MRHVSFDHRLTFMQSFACFMLVQWFCVGLTHTFPFFSPFVHSRSLSQGSTNAAVLDVAQAGGHKKRVRRSSFLNAKKLYEDAQMARKVKQYLSNLDLEMDEESLQTLSLQCEPATNTCECCHLLWVVRRLLNVFLSNTREYLGMATRQWGKKLYNWSWASTGHLWILRESS